MRTKIDRDLVQCKANELNYIDVNDIDQAITYVNEVIESYPFTYFSILKGQRFSKIWNVIFEKTKFLDEYFSPNTATRIYYFIHRMSQIHVCEVCGKPYLRQLRAGNPTPDFIHCSTFCAQRNPKVSAKIKSTKIENKTTTKDLIERTRQRNREKYGVDWYFQTDKFANKKLETWKSHGYDHPMHSDDVKKGMQQRLEEKYGFKMTSTFQIPSVKQKIIEHNRATYGVDWPMQSPELWKVMHDNTSKTIRRNYYNRVLVNYSNYDLLTTEDEYVNMKLIVPEGMTTPRTLLKWRCKKCGSEFEQLLYLYADGPRCLKCNPLLHSRTDSNEEIDVFNFMSTVEGSRYECMRHSFYNWNIIENRGLDIVCVNKETKEPEIAVEFNGMYWHSVENKPKGYHLMKTLKCEEAGVKLIHIWEDEWFNEQDKIKELLANALAGKSVFDESQDIVELDRSKVCKLWVPESYDIIESQPSIRMCSVDGKKKYITEDCGKLIIRKK